MTYLPEITKEHEPIMRALLRFSEGGWRKQIIEASGLPINEVDPVLAVWQSYGIVAARWAPLHPRKGGPIRLYYTVTTRGLSHLRAAQERLEEREA